MEIKKNTEFSYRLTELTTLDFQVVDTALCTHKKFERTEIKFSGTKNLNKHKYSFQALEAGKYRMENLDVRERNAEIELSTNILIRDLGHCKDEVKFILYST